jgi:hypothetical protein
MRCYPSPSTKKRSSASVKAFTKGLGVLMLLGSLNPITAPFVAGYALADLGLQVFTGTSLTDRIGNGIDNMNGVMLEPK